MKALNNAILAIVFLAIAFFAGYFLRKPEIQKVEIPGPVQVEQKIIYRDTGRIVQIPSDPIDSAAVVQAYYTKRPFYFEDTLQSVSIRFDGILFENKLTAPKLTLHNFREPISESPWSLWIDARAALNSLELGASMQKGPNRFGAGYDLIQGQLSIKYSRRVLLF